MTADQCLVLYGSSVFLAGIMAEMERSLPVKLVTISEGSLDAAAKIHACNPYAVLFDLTVGLPEFTAAFMREHPGLLMIGVDPSCDELLVLSVQPQRAMSLTDLIDIIRAKAASSENSRE